jgi:hypothetical protein
MGILDYNETVGKHYLGYASISFRTTNFQSDTHKAFVLNSKNDGWFRKDNGIADGFGLCINEIKITSKTVQDMGSYLVYKCKIEYTDWEEYPETDLFWLYVHKNFELEEIMEYISENKEKWYP